MLRWKDYIKFSPENSECDPVESGKPLRMMPRHSRDCEDHDDKENNATTLVRRIGSFERPGKPSLAMLLNHEKPEWQKRLSEQLQEKEQRLAKRRKSIPTMTREQLQCINTVWSILEKQGRSSQTTAQHDQLHRLSNALGVSYNHVHAILHGDPDHVVPEPDKQEILQKLGMWAQHQSLTFNTSTTRTPLVKVRSPLNTKSSRHALHNVNAHGMSSEGLSSPVMTTSTRTRSTKSKSCSPRPRLSSAFHHNTDVRINMPPKRRSSTCSMHSSITSLSSCYSTSTTSGKRAARPSYEPPSVRRRKLRRSGRLSMVHMGSERNHLLSLNKRMALEKKAFCPIEAARQKIVSEMTRLQQQRQYGHQEQQAPTVKAMEMEHLELSLQVWDKIQTNPEEKVEVVVASMASTLELSHRRLTRFLRGDQANLLTKQEAIKISTKLRSWIENP